MLFLVLMKLHSTYFTAQANLKANATELKEKSRAATQGLRRSGIMLSLCPNLRTVDSNFNRMVNRLSGRGGDVEIGMRNTSKTSSQKALLEASDEE